MANLNAPRGLQPVGDIHGNRYVAPSNRYYKGVAAANRICKGDRVVLSATATTDPNGYPEILKVAPGTAGTGVVVGIDTVVGQPHKLCYESTDVGYVMVEDDMNVLYEVQEGGAGTAFTLAAIGQTCNLIANADGNQSTGLSILQLNNATLGTGTDVQVMGISHRSDNAVGAQCKWLVKLYTGAAIA